MHARQTFSHVFVLLSLFSFWGKFGERLNKPMTVTIQNPSDLYALLYDTTKDVSTLRICTDEVLEAVYTSIDANANKGSKTNIFIAAFTTCHARLELYKSLDALQDRVLYYDTDSVIFRWAPGLVDIPTGDYLGDMKDELEGDSIVEFVSGGAKNYAYRTVGGKTCCKVRGFTLNVRGAARLNFHTMKANILSELDDPQDERRTLSITDPYFFTRDVPHKRIRLGPREKRYGLVFDKRVIDVSSRTSRPYGFQRLQRHDLDNMQHLVDLLDSEDEDDL